MELIIYSAGAVVILWLIGICVLRIAARRKRSAAKWSQMARSATQMRSTGVSDKYGIPYGGSSSGSTYPAHQYGLQNATYVDYSNERSSRADVVDESPRSSYSCSSSSDSTSWSGSSDSGSSYSCSSSSYD